MLRPGSSISPKAQFPKCQLLYSLWGLFPLLCVEIQYVCVSPRGAALSFYCTSAYERTNLSFSWWLRLKTFFLESQDFFLFFLQLAASKDRLKAECMKILHVLELSAVSHRLHWQSLLSNLLCRLTSWASANKDDVIRSKAPEDFEWWLFLSTWAQNNGKFEKFDNEDCGGQSNERNEQRTRCFSQRSKGSNTFTHF